MSALASPRGRVAPAPWTSTELLARLVSFDTTSRNSNLELMAFVQDLFDANGVAWHETRSADGRKRNLHARIGPAVAGGLALSGHVDTVPVDGQRWASDPFALRRDGGRLYGRGTADMKGFVACALAAVPHLVGLTLARPIHLFVTFDEEVNMEGARRLVASLDETDWPRPAACVVGEPTSMQPVVGHKGRLAAHVRVRGRAGHSAEPGRGVNAIHAAARAIGWLADRADERATRGPFVAGFAPAYTTSQVGTVHGGAILNIIPDAAEFGVEWRTVPGDDAPELLAAFRAHCEKRLEPAMHAVDPTTRFGFEVRDWVPGLALPLDHELATVVRHAAGSNASGYVSYATEGGLFEAAGLPTIVCGPGSIQQAHAPDEFIDAAELDRCDAFIRRMAQGLLA